jgi:hypothetical protein
MKGNSAVGALFLFTPTLVAAQGLEVIHPIQVLEPPAIANLGVPQALAYDGDWAIVGHPGHEIGGSYVGSVTVYHRDADGVWQLQQTLVPPEPVEGFFGYSVALEGNLALIGAPVEWNGASAAGAAYLLERQGDQWSLVEHFVPQAPHPLFLGNNNFGIAVALRGSVALVGAPGDPTGGDCVGIPEDPPPPWGAVYVYSRDGAGSWSLARKLVGSEQECAERTGVGIALDHHGAIVGRLGSPLGTGTETALVLSSEPSGAWSEVGNLTASGTVGPFRSSMASDGATAVVMAQRETAAAYVFEHDPGGGWSETGTLELDGLFGDIDLDHVDVHGDRIVASSGNGAATLFERASGGSFVEAASLTSSTPNPWLGRAGVELHGPRVMIGSWDAAYFFLLDEELRVSHEQHGEDVVLRWLGGTAPYSVDRAFVPEGPWTTLTPPGGIAVQSWTDVGVLLDGLDYHYRIRSAGEP